MNEIVSKLVEKTGITEEQANKVMSFLKDNKEKVPGWLAQSGVKDAVTDKLPGGMGKLLG